MDLKEIMSVSGQGRLFKFVSQARNGIIVESFSDNKRSFISASTKVSSLEDIAVFTDEKEIPLKEVFRTIQSLEPEVTIPEPGSAPEELKEFMGKVLPNYNRSRVYVSDIKKIVGWYGTLKEKGLLEFEEEVRSDSDADADSGKSP